MNNIFSGCSSLTKINLFNFNTQNVTDMSRMFNGCSSLKGKGVIINDKNILKELFYL